MTFKSRKNEFKNMFSSSGDATVGQIVRIGRRKRSTVRQKQGTKKKNRTFGDRTERAGSEINFDNTL